MPIRERIPERLSELSRRRHRGRQQRRSAEFIRGPIPLGWLLNACGLPGSALPVGLAVWFGAGCQGKRQAVPICNSLLSRFGVERIPGYRGLRALEQAGLVSVERHHGRCPRVTILAHKGNARGAAS
jgi:hypothetical protein